jgi:hypothetical protein
MALGAIDDKSAKTRLIISAHWFILVGATLNQIFSVACQLRTDWRG